MSFPTFTPPVAPVVGSTERREIKLLETQFGDGYTQSTPDGMNFMRLVFNIRWEVLDLEDARAIDDFLVRQCGSSPFYFTAPGRSTPTLCTCKEWSMTHTTGGFASIDATFRQSFTTRA